MSWNLHPGSQKGASDDTEIEEGLLHSEECDGEGRIWNTTQSTKWDRRRSWLGRNWTWAIQSVMMICSVAILILSRHGEQSDAACTRKLFPYSPALEVVSYHDQTLQGGFLQPSPYRGSPTPEIDTRWQELWDWGAFNVPADKITLLNKSRSASWHHTDQAFGGGVAGLFWGFHQLHCLDLLRQMSYKDEYEKAQDALPSILRDDQAKRRLHLDHCIELLRIDMMCQADVTPYLVMERESTPDSPDKPLDIDFSVFKKCRDFDKIRDWMRDHIAIPSIRDTGGHGG